MELPSLYDVDEVRELGGIVDYTVGPPGVKIFCLAEHPDPEAAGTTSSLYKMGDGPLYPFWVPYHLPHFDAPNSDRAGRPCSATALATPLGGPVVEVCAVAKRDLEAGETLDEYGMFMTYGEAVERRGDEQRSLPPRRARRGLPPSTRRRRDEVLTYDDVDLPEGRLADTLRAEQYSSLPRRDVARGAVACVAA